MNLISNLGDQDFQIKRETCTIPYQKNGNDMSQKFKVAFAGFRHGHIDSLLETMNASDDFDVVACCEEDEATRRSLADKGTVAITHERFADVLENVPCDVIAIGDYYAKRGSIAIQALKAGRHVIADKPLCTDLGELDEIRSLAKARALCVGCMLDLRSSRALAAVRRLVAEGRLGKITQILFTAQHPLNRDTRPSWYFEPGKHGGTVNDIGSHAVDIIPWIAGSSIAKITAAREWQAFDVRSDSFCDAAQVMFELDNGAGVMGDVSYSAPSTFGYTHPSYWRFTFWGTLGMLECNVGSQTVAAYFDGEKEPLRISVDSENPKSYLDAFLDDLRGIPTELDTDCVLASARDALLLQQAAWGKR